MVGLAQKIILYNYTFRFNPQVICEHYLEHARLHWRIVTSGRGVDSDREFRRCKLPSFDNEGNLVLLHSNANGILMENFLMKKIAYIMILIRNVNIVITIFYKLVIDNILNAFYG